MAFPNSGFTLPGDQKQAIYEHALGDRSLADTPLGDEVIVMELGKSYRSTEQLVVFTRYLLGARMEIQSVARAGEKPVLVQLDLETDIVPILWRYLMSHRAQGAVSMAVIGRTARDCWRLFGELSEYGRRANPEMAETMRLVTEEDQEFRSGISAMPAYLAKGLEFDR